MMIIVLEKKYYKGSIFGQLYQDFPLKGKKKHLLFFER